MLEYTVIDGSDTVKLRFEHSLLSLSKWESKYKVAFSSTSVKPTDQMIDYYQFMLIDDVDPTLVYRLSPEDLDGLTKYINDPMTASSVPIQNESRGPKETMTSELIYYWMVELGIPFEAERWHLNRLMTLIQITSFKKQPPKKQSPQKMLNDWREANAARKKQYGTNG